MSASARPGEDSWSRDDATNRDAYRRRSPAPKGPNRRQRDGRPRSRSPQAIDRYQPARGQERRDDHRRRSPPPVPQANIDRYVPGQEPAVPLVNPLPNPLSLDYQVGFNWFAEWWRKDQEVKEERERQKNGGRRPPPRLKGEQESREERDKEREKIQAAYDDYKLKLQAQLSRLFVQQHKDHEWFKERYDPEVRDPFRQRQADFRRSNYSQWLSDLEAGTFDEFTLEGIYKSESNGAGGVVEKEEGETTAAAEVLGVGDLLPSKGGDLRDEAALLPALLIKTIAPHVSREKMEAFCKEHLADAEGGFRWLSLSDPNPVKKYHRIGWVLLNPGGDRTIEVEKKVDRPDGREEEEDVDDQGEEGEDRMQEVTTETVTEPAVDIALAAINGKSISLDEDKGTFTCHVGVHVPPSAPRKKALWDLFSAPERIERDLDLALRLVSKFDVELGEESNATYKIEERVEDLRGKGVLQPQDDAATSKPQKTSNDDDDMADDGEEGEMDEDEGVVDDETDDEELLVKKKKLDLLVEYLRRVHNFCFFCVFESDSVHELTRKCPGGHLRRPRASLTSSAKIAARASANGEPFPIKKGESNAEQESEEANTTGQDKRFNRHNKTYQQLQRAFTWVKTYEDKLFQILEPDAVDIKKLGGKPLEEGLEEELKKYVKQEDEARYRCKVPDCTKLFRGEVFWRKHVDKRHEEWLEAQKKNLYLINNYVIDPAHIAPSKPDVVSNGHFPTNNSMPTGTPRGFSLSTMPMGFPNPMTAMPNPNAFPPVPGPYPMPMPGFGPNMAIDPATGHVGPAPGPMRRQRGGGGGGFHNRAGPYDRNPKQRWGGGPGRLTPPRGGKPGGMGAMGMGMQPRFADSTMPSAVGPKEAVAGRSLKSYEDLDAVSGEGNGELDY